MRIGRRWKKMDPTVGIIATAMMLALFGVMKYALNTFGPNPQTWEPAKFYPLLLVGLVIVLGGWYINGTMEIPTDSAIEAVLPYIQPVFATLGLSLTVLLGGKYGKTVVQAKALTGAAAAAKPVAAGTVADPIKYLGFTVTPAFLGGKSPFAAVLLLKASTIVTDWMIDWKDGTPIQTGKFVIEGEYAIAQVAHAYTYTFDGKYTGRTFYPAITVTSKDGVTNTFNTEAQGRCVSIEVAS
jgi:hypothetical protein